MKMTLTSTALLGAIALASSLALSVVYTTTKPVIEELDRNKQKNALSLVLPGYTVKEEKFLDSSDSSTKYWIAESSDGSKAWAIICESSGYSGTIRLMAGVDQKGTILGISILNQTETPGLGARCVEIASTSTFFDFILGKPSTEKDSTPWFQKQFGNLSSQKKISVVKKGDYNDSMKESLLKNNEISAITGATITSTAVTKAVEDGIDKYRSIFSK